MNMHDIEELTKEFAGTRNMLAMGVKLLNDELEAVKKKHLNRIKLLVNRAAERKHALCQAVEMSPDLFKRPRTQLFHGIKVGMQKGKGKLEYADEEKVIARLKKYYGAEVEDGHFIKVAQSIIKKDLEKLPADELKKLGVSIKDAEDEVVIKPMDSDVEKMVDALLKGAEDETKGEAA